MVRLLLIFPAILCLSLAQEHEYEYEVTTVDLSEVNPGTRIIGGVASTIERYPYTVQVAQNSQLICAGSLLTRRHVLSAAHCFVSQSGNVANVNMFSIRAGTTNLNSGGQTRRVSAIIVHERYNRITHDADVAVLLLQTAVTLGALVETARIPIQDARMRYDAALIHVGWGRTVANESGLSPVLREVMVLKVNHSVCAERYGWLALQTHSPMPVTDTMICAGLMGIGGADACLGDSGGPLIFVNVVVGVTSWGYSCGHPDFPGVSARVSYFTDWIQNTVQRYNSAPSLSTGNFVVLIISLLASLIFVKRA